MVGEEIAIFKDFTPVISLIIIMVIGGRWIIQKTFDQTEFARKNFTDYVEKTTEEHTEAMNKLSESILVLSADLKNHTRSKDDFIYTINEQRKTINELFEMLKEQIKTNR